MTELTFVKGCTSLWNHFIEQGLSDLSCYAFRVIYCDELNTTVTFPGDCYILVISVLVDNGKPKWVVWREMR